MMLQQRRVALESPHQKDRRFDLANMARTQLPSFSPLLFPANKKNEEIHEIGKVPMWLAFIIT